MNKQTATQPASILISLDEYLQLVNNQSTGETTGKIGKKVPGKQLRLTPNMKKVVAARALLTKKHHVPPSAPPQSPPASSLTSTAATATTEAANAGVEQRLGNKKKLKMKHLDQPTAAATTTTTGSATTRARQCTMSFTCLSKTRLESPVSPVTSVTARETGSLSDTCLSATTLELPVISPLPSTSTITITKPEPVKTGKRKRSPTPTSTKISRHYTNGRVINREMFSTQVEKVLAGAASSLGPIHNQDERIRREELAAYFLDWHLDRAVEFAVNDLKRKFRQ